MEQLLEAIRSCRIYDLAQPYYAGMPHHPNHPPFLFGLNKKHGDYVASNGGSSASEALTLGGHVGTHIDALCHFSCGGKLHGGEEAAGLQSYTSGLERHAVDTIAPIFRRGILLDIAGQSGVEALPADFEITPGHLEAAADAAHVENRAGRCGAVAHGMGPLLGRCGALHRAGSWTGTRRARRALAKLAGSIRRGIRYGGV